MDYKEISWFGDVITGSTPSTSDKNNYMTNDIPFIKPDDLDKNDITYIYNNKYFVSNYCKKKVRLFPKGSVLCSCIGIIGKIGISTQESCCNQQINVIIPDTKKVYSEFLAYSLKYQSKYFAPKANAPVVPLINKNDFLKIKIPYYSLEKQKVIINEINGIIKNLRLSKSLINNLDNIVKSQFIEMFMDKDLPYIKMSELSIGKAEYGAGSASIEYNVDRPRYVRITDINEDGTLNDDYVSSINLDDDEQYKLEYGDFMFARMGATVGKTYAFYEGNQIFAGYLIRFKLDLNKINPRYLFWYTKLEDYNKWVVENQSGAAQPGINAKKYSELSIPCASLDLQNKFADFVQQIDKSKSIVQKQIKLLEELLEKKMNEYFGE